jgi:hypothetical protein
MAGLDPATQPARGSAPINQPQRHKDTKVSCFVSLCLCGLLFSAPLTRRNWVAGSSPAMVDLRNERSLGIPHPKQTRAPGKPAGFLRPSFILMP